MPGQTIDIMSVSKELESKSAEEVLKWALSTYHPRIALASSFQIEESVMIDMMVKIHGSDIRVFTLDTGRINEETYEVMEKIREKYGIKIEAYFPDLNAVEKLEKEKGLFSFRQSIENRKECCKIRKVASLNRALGQLDAWITGLRREQAVTRGDIPKVEIDEPHNRMAKINPLIDWDTNQVWDYIKKNKLPYNQLYDKGYTSIGCAPCTRAIRKGEDARAGRWWWESPEQKECGLHVKK